MNIILWAKTWMTAFGAAPVLYLMLALSVISVSIIIERACTFAMRYEDPRALGRDLRAYLASDDLEGARARMDASPSPEAFVLVALFDQK